MLVDGRRIDRIEVYGKHIFYGRENDLVEQVHLGLFGKFPVSRHELGETSERKGIRADEALD